MNIAASRWRWAALLGLAALVAGAGAGCDEDDEEQCFELSGSLAQVTSDTVTTDHLGGVFSPDGTRILFSTDFWGGEDYEDREERDFALIDVPLPSDPPRTPLARLFDAHNARRLLLPVLPTDDGSQPDARVPNVGEADWDPTSSDEVALVVESNQGFDRIFFFRIDFGSQSAQSIDLEYLDRVTDVDLAAAAAVNRNQYYYRSPAYSPDGQWLAYSRFFYREDESNPNIVEYVQPAIFAVNVDDGRVVRVTQGSSFESEPTWSPDGSTIAFSSNRSGAVGMLEIFRVPFDPDDPVDVGETDGAVRLTNTNTQEDPKIYTGSFEPKWMSNGRIVFVSTRRVPCTSLRDRNIWVMDGSGGEPSLVYASREDDHFPGVWTGGNTIVFSSRQNPIADFEGQKTDLWLLRGF